MTSVWNPVRELMSESDIKLSKTTTQRLKDRSLLPLLSCYKFVSKLIGDSKEVLHLNCEDGLGTYILSKECGYAMGISQSEDEIEYAKKTWKGDVDFAKESKQKYDAVVALDLNRLTIDGFKQVSEELLKPAGLFLVGGKYANRVQNNFTKHYLQEYMTNFKYIFKFYGNQGVFQAGESNNLDYLLYMGVKGV